MKRLWPAVVLASSCTVQDLIPDALTVHGGRYRGEQDFGALKPGWGDVNHTGVQWGGALTWNLFQGWQEQRESDQWTERIENVQVRFARELARMPPPQPPLDYDLLAATLVDAFPPPNTGQLLNTMIRLVERPLPRPVIVAPPAVEVSVPPLELPEVQVTVELPELPELPEETAEESPAGVTILGLSPELWQQVVIGLVVLMGAVATYLKRDSIPLVRDWTAKGRAEKTEREP